MVNIANLNLCTEVEGPFKRAAIWFQGCLLKCEGCCNEEYQSFDKKNLVEVDDLIKILLKSREENGIEGVTLLGGEPCLQSHLYELLVKLKQCEFGIILFTGYKLSEINQSIIENCDLVVDGKFDIKKIDVNRNMIGSTNQNINLITNRYAQQVRWFTDKRVEKSDEINITDENLIINGDVIFK